MENFYEYKGMMRTGLSKDERRVLLRAAAKEGKTLVAYADSILREAIRRFENGEHNQP